MHALPEKPGNFLYADACPRCHEPLKHNLAREFGAEAEGGDAKALARAGTGVVHPICGKLESGIPAAAKPL